MMSVLILGSAFTRSVGLVAAILLAIVSVSVAGLVMSGRGHWLGLLFGLITILSAGFVALAVFGVGGTGNGVARFFAIDLVWPAIPLVMGSVAVTRFLIARRAQRRAEETQRSNAA